jgi:signal transduction histidine kinase
MKRTIVVGLGIYTLLFFLGGLYILKVIHDATSKLDRLIVLHKVEILREHYLIQIRRVQTDLTLAGTRHSRAFDTVVANARNMGNVIDTCFDCHHSGPTLEGIQDLKRQTEDYKISLSRVITIRANPERLAAEEDTAFRIGEQLILKVSQMIAVTGARLEEATETALKEIDDTKYVLYFLVGVGPLLAAGLGLVLVTGITKPLGVLLQSTRKLKGGDLDHRVAGLTQEFGELAGAFNEMAASLKEQMLRMQRAEQLAVVGELAAGLAHEIKNPLAGIKVAMHVLADEASLSDEDRAVVRKVGDEVTRLETLMKSFLSFARPAKPRPVEMHLNALLSTTLEFYGRDRRPRVGGEERVRVAKEFGTVPATLADPMQMQQVFLNLVINAFDSMPQGGTLTVRTRIAGAPPEIVAEIADTGKGIDAENRSRIFQPFFTTKHGGTGLGLPVSRQLVEQHGGTIEVAENPGGGTVFTVRLPIRAPGGKEAA